MRLLIQWNARFNLVSANSLAEVWRRHILDSAQLRAHIPATARTTIDLGSGAGLPGLVLAITGLTGVHLVESSRKKAEFLREAARLTDTQIVIHACRIEEVPAFPADAITSRALAPLDKLLGYASRFAGPGTICLFPKGRGVADELTSARRKWIMRTQLLGSLSDPQGHILRVEGLQHAPNRSASGSPADY